MKNKQTILIIVLSAIIVLLAGCLLLEVKFLGSEKTEVKNPVITTIDNNAIATSTEKNIASFNGEYGVQITFPGYHSDPHNNVIDFGPKINFCTEVSKEYCRPTDPNYLSSAYALYFTAHRSVAEAVTGIVQDSGNVMGGTTLKEGDVTTEKINGYDVAISCSTGAPYKMEVIGMGTVGVKYNYVFIGQTKESCDYFRGIIQNMKPFETVTDKNVFVDQSDGLEISLPGSYEYLRAVIDNKVVYIFSNKNNESINFYLETIPLRSLSEIKNDVNKNSGMYVGDKIINGFTVASWQDKVGYSSKFNATEVIGKNYNYVFKVSGVLDSSTDAIEKEIIPNIKLIK